MLLATDLSAGAGRTAARGGAGAVGSLGRDDVQQRSDDALAEDRRLLADLFAVATSADSARELRTYGITDALARRHDELTRTGAPAHGSRGAAERGARGGRAGWCSRSASIAAIVVLVLRAADGHVSPGAGRDGRHAAAPGPDPDLALDRHRRQLQHRASQRPASCCGSRIAPQTAPTQAERRAMRRCRRGCAPASGSRRLTFAYPGSDERPVARVRSSSSFPPGRTIALVGENGAGKTTLVKLLCAMYRAHRRVGSRIDGTDLAAARGDGVAASASAAAFQDFQRLQFIARSRASGPATSRGSRSHEPVRGRAGASRLGARSRQQLPDGLDDAGRKSLHRRARALGRAVAAARAGSRPDAQGDRCWSCSTSRPRASTHQTESALFARYASAARALADAYGTITLLVSHRFSTVRTADLIIVLEHGLGPRGGLARGVDGRLAATYAELFELQARAYG